MIAWLLRAGALYPARHHQGVRPHIAGLGTDQNSKLEVQLLLNAYCFCSVIKKKKNIRQTIVEQGFRPHKKSTLCVFLSDSTGLEGG